LDDLMAGPLITTEELAERLGSPGLVILDASWFMPGEARNPRAEYAGGHIPGAVYFDIDEVADRSSDLPHMMAEPHDFATHARRLGVNPDSTIVVYDSAGVFSAPRVWWNFRAMGHGEVYVLDGGLLKWASEGRPVELGWPEPPPHGEFKARPVPGLVRTIDQVSYALNAGTEQVVDARAAPRFRGDAPEPRPGLRSGHMPGAVNLPWQSIVMPDGTLAEPAVIQEVFDTAGVDLSRPVVTSCGSGISASLLALGLAMIGRDDVAVYDGSWSEWGARADAPVATGT
jgi:thiosulfate/3-mercaptopyruvate sulfurtransferase